MTGLPRTTADRSSLFLRGKMLLPEVALNKLRLAGELLMRAPFTRPVCVSGLVSIGFQVRKRATLYDPTRDWNGYQLWRQKA
jgi:hypothetical protein